MKKYEYKVIKTKQDGFWNPKLSAESVELELNKLGQEGWELVSAMDTAIGHGTTNEIVMFFKRESRF